MYRLVPLGTGRFVAAASAVFVLGCLSTACDVSEEAVPSFELRDSTGVQVSRAPASILSLADEWNLGDDPSTAIGAVDGAEEYLLSSVATAWRVEDGGIVVADRGHDQLRQYDSNGQFIRAIGGPGAGPGEFAALAMANPYRGDSIATWDSGAQRITVFDHDGEVGRTVPIEWPAEEPQGSGRTGLSVGPEFLGSFADGSFVFRPPVTIGIDPGERRAMEASLVRYSPEGSLLNRFGPFVRGDVVGPVSASPFIPVPTPFSRSFAADLGKEQLYVGASVDYEVQTFSLDGTLEARLHVHGLDLSLDEAARDQYRETYRRFQAEREMPPENIERSLEAVSFPPTRPPYEDILVDAEGLIWIRDYEPSDTDEPAVWRGYRPEGGILARITVPSALSVEQVGRDFILAVRTDELDVQYVKVYPLSRQ